MRAWLATALLCYSLRALKIVKSPLDIYIIAGSHNQPQVLHVLLTSMSLDKDLWFLLNHPSLDFRIAWDQTCDVLRPHPIWKNGPEAISEKFMTPNCLVAFRGVDTEAAIALAGSFDTRSVLDLRTFANFCPFGHEDNFAEGIFSKAAWGFGPLVPSGQWCRSLNWRSYYPEDIWPLFDIECLESMDHARRYKVPVFDLITDKDSWSLFTEEPNHMMAVFRYIHFSVLEKELMQRPWLTRLNAMCGVYRTKLIKQIPFLQISDSPWMAVFLALVDGAWDGNFLHDQFIPLIRNAATIEPSLQNRMILYMMALLSYENDLHEDDIRYLQFLFIDLLQDQHSNPIYLSKFMEFATTGGNDFSSLIPLTLMNYKRVTFNSAECLGANLWEIFLRQHKNFPRDRELLLGFSLRDRKAMALKSLRHVSMHRKLGFWANVPYARSYPKPNDFWGPSSYLLPDILSNYNGQSLQTFTIILAPDQRNKVNFGFGWCGADVRDDFAPVKDKLEACHVLEAVLQHELLAIDSRGGMHSYEKCFSSPAGCYATRTVNLMIMLFVFGCKVSSALLPSTNFAPIFNQADKVNMDGNWLNFSELRRAIEKPITII